MGSNSSNPDDATGSAAHRWREESEKARQRLLVRLAERGVDTSRFDWLSPAESEATVQRWVELGAQRYGSLALIAPPGVNAARGEYRDGDIPPWLARSSRRVFVLFFQDFRMQFLARCDFEFVLDNLVAMARADGDGFAAMTGGLEGTLLVNVEEKLGNSALEIEAWGEFIYGAGM
jgi:hypothetical protein